MTDTGLSLHLAFDSDQTHNYPSPEGEDDSGPQTLQRKLHKPKLIHIICILCVLLSSIFKIKHTAYNSIYKTIFIHSIKNLDLLYTEHYCNIEKNIPCTLSLVFLFHYVMPVQIF